MPRKKKSDLIKEGVVYLDESSIDFGIHDVYENSYSNIQTNQTTGGKITLAKVQSLMTAIYKTYEEAAYQTYGGSAIGIQRNRECSTCGFINPNKDCSRCG